MKNKKIRAFYEEQNERLNDWLEVDTLVRHLADDVFDAFDPQDHDGDGRPEAHSALHTSGEDVEPFLPDDERERRQKNKKYNWWAINVRRRSRHKTYGHTECGIDKCYCECFSTCREDCGFVILFITFPHSIVGGQRIGPAVHCNRMDDEPTRNLETYWIEEKISCRDQYPMFDKCVD